jgi:hypothetical protein
LLKSNKQASANALKELIVELKDNEAKKFLVNLVMKQQKQSGMKRLPLSHSLEIREIVQFDLITR